MELAQDRVQWKALILAVLNLVVLLPVTQFSQNAIMSCGLTFCGEQLCHHRVLGCVY
jgi:hypothetical protein